MGYILMIILGVWLGLCDYAKKNRDLYSLFFYSSYSASIILSFFKCANFS